MDWFEFCDHISAAYDLSLSIRGKTSDAQRPFITHCWINESIRILEFNTAPKYGQPGQVTRKPVPTKIRIILFLHKKTFFKQLTST